MPGLTPEFTGPPVKIGLTPQEKAEGFAALFNLLQPETMASIAEKSRAAGRDLAMVPAGAVGGILDMGGQIYNILGLQDVYRWASGKTPDEHRRERQAWLEEQGGGIATDIARGVAPYVATGVATGGAASAVQASSRAAIGLAALGDMAVGYVNTARDEPGLTDLLRSITDPKGHPRIAGVLDALIDWKDDSDLNRRLLAAVGDGMGPFGAAAVSVLGRVAKGLRSAASDPVTLAQIAEIGAAATAALGRAYQPPADGVAPPTRGELTTLETARTFSALVETAAERIPAAATAGAVAGAALPGAPIEGGP